VTTSNKNNKDTPDIEEEIEDVLRLILKVGTVIY
jgi:hypothetical protein